MGKAKELKRNKKTRKQERTLIHVLLKTRLTITSAVDEVTDKLLCNVEDVWVLERGNLEATLTLARYNKTPLNI